MIDLLYITGNPSKLRNAATFLKSYNIAVEGAQIDMNEIQADDAVLVAIQKARDAFATLQTPLFVNDASWHIPALGGFPGPYMRYIVEWLTAEDLLNLMKNKQDRTIILKDTIVYKTASIEKVFTNEVQGIILPSPSDTSTRPFVNALVSFEQNGKSLAEVNTVGFTRDEATLWRNFGSYIKTVL